MTLDGFRFIRSKIEFYRNEIATFKKRREEFVNDMNTKGNSIELVTAIVGLDDLREKAYDSLISQYEDMIVVLEVLANIKTDERLPRQ